MVLKPLVFYVRNLSTTMIDSGRFGNNWKAKPTYQPSTNTIYTSPTSDYIPICCFTHQQNKQADKVYGNFQY